MKHMHAIAAIISLMCLNMSHVFATTIQYAVTNIAGSTWEYSYNIINDSLALDIEEFTIYFESGRYQGLNLAAAPEVAGWDPIVVNPNNFLNNDGFYDALAMTGGAAPGTSLGGFSVRFDFIGTGMPGPQRFEIVDPVSFTVLDSGNTSPVPLPAALLLFGSGLAGLIGLASKRHRSTRLFPES